MNDQEFLEFVERTTFEAMMEAVLLEDFYGYKTYKPGLWPVSFSANEIGRLLDMAIANKKCSS